MLNLALSMDAKIATGGGAAGVVYDTDAQTYFTAMTAQPDATRKGHLNTLIAGLKTDGVWTILDRLHLFASHDAQSALLNAIDPTQSALAVNTPTFTADLGYTGDAVSMHINFNELPTAAGNNFAQDSACIGAWCNQQSATSGQSWHMGPASGSNVLNLRPRNTAGNENFQTNEATAGTLVANTGSRVGHRTASRTSSLIKRGFVNGVRTADLSIASTAVPTGNLCGLRALTGYSDDRLACGYCGGGLSDAEVGNMHTRLNTYLTAIGAN